jgi:hypothetical protein
MNTTRIVTAALALALAAGGGLLRAESTVSAADRYAYGANTGWIDARADLTNGAALGRSYCSGHLWSANVGWIGLGNGPTNGWRYTQTSGSDWGVNHDGAGRLTGYAYGANIGWITFEQTYGQPRIDLLSGSLSGYAWGANVGWISLANSQAHVRTDRLDDGPDADGDGIPDAWEYQVAGGLTTLGAGASDSDGDGVPDADEYGADTDPLDPGSRLAITEFARAGDTDVATWPVAQTRLYRLQQTESLRPAPAVWSDSGFGLIAPDGAPTVTRGVTEPAATQRFYRVQAVLPLSP